MVYFQVKNKLIAVNAMNKSAVVLFGLICVAQSALAGPQVLRWQQASGAQVALVSSPGIPMLDVRLDFDGGSRRDPPEQAGLAAVTALMSQRGLSASAPTAGGAGGGAVSGAVNGGGAQDDGTALGENQLTERWMDLGAQWSVGAGADQFSATLRTLTAPDVLPQAVALAARQLAHPRWQGDEAQAIWQRERERLSAAWRNASTQPATIAQRRFAAAVYGPHPYGQEATPETLARIGLADMQAHWQRTVRPCRARITLVGDVTQAQAQDIVTRLLAPLVQSTQADPSSNATCPALPAVPEVSPLASASDIRVPLRTAQAHLLLGQPGHARSDPDYFPLLLGNYILGGGGFVSRLTTEVREKRGLSYGAYSYFAPGLHAGAFQVGLQTRPDQAEQALAVARDVVQHFVQDGSTEAELAAAKTYMVNSFALRMDTNRKLLDNVANMLWHGLPTDYLDTWPQAIAAVTVNDIRRAFSRVLQPGRMVSVVVGGPGG
jgi:zinc protease